MATWQADFTVLFSAPWPPDYAKRLDSVASRSRELWPSTTTWGHEEGNRLDVHFEDGHPDTAMLRLDMSSWDSQFAEHVLSLLRQWGCRLTGPNGQVVEAVLGDVALAARGSPAFRFVKDPDLFFRRLQLGGLEDA